MDMHNRIKPLQDQVSKICVYCGSRDGGRSQYRQAAAVLGQTLARQGLGLVYGGARVGLMGAVADAAMAAGASVLGVLPQGLAGRELAHRGLTELRVVETMHQRKAAMAQAAAGFIALPGGLGTLEELFEILTWRQLGWHDKPVGLLDIDGFYQPLLAGLRQMAEHGFIEPASIDNMLVAADPRTLVARMKDNLGQTVTMSADQLAR